MACILVVDQNENLARLEVLYLRSRGYQALGVYDVSEAIQCLLAVIVDLVVLDLLTCMKEEARIGQTLTSLLESRDTPVLLVRPSRSLAGVGHDICFLSDRAVGHLVKPFEIKELGQRVAALLAQKPTALQGLPLPLKVGRLTLDLQKFELRCDDRQVLLTPTEFDLLHYLMEHVGETTSTQKLLEAVWQHPTGGGSPEVVRWHMKRLRDKLIKAGCPEVIRTMARRGYVIPVWVERDR